MSQPKLDVDTDYHLEHFVSGPLLPDLEYLYRRISDATVATIAERPPGRVLDVGSGASTEMARLAQLGWETYAVDPSAHMLGVSRLTEEQTAAPVQLVRAIGEQLPFADNSLDAVACQAALDHFSDRHAFMAETARIIKPDGRVIISLNNFEGLACRMGRLLHPVARASRVHHCADWPCWDIPADHTFKGDWEVVQALGGSRLVLERAYGVSLLTMFYGWGHLLSRLPKRLRSRLLLIADAVAHGRPAQSDVIFSIWRRAS
ncbi:MAG: class I SAM-dependent methyltransferase [Chloroflexi bacterium]|nr:class I SAM-dependent methyltransferase [Chloroflexota bacterium]